ncbi:adhesive plaque matrix protein-like [Tigriopus californicus]|uniref:adhesive plaque matrix protein-like n=1 Tax=Tigriopus californicus TaxID=6832 RepID=UPI0027DA77F0|nr:adhesive plaque matrix protein-like [Tigriopus californicus]XP_059087551.1 adhesive plaque matrix protein-like [Tigriopus californicus]|eukprot:TCALIF_10127-PA protein Name:"Similar to resilin Pro-resilin (Drosophila melanogaster)" AED:0.25 eAED:0.25 QI:817/1/0.8/1/0.5/0.4/5/0/325
MIRLSTSLALCLSLISVALADNSYAQPSYDEPANYQFKYEVKDEYTGQDFGQEEARSGYNTDGEYQVLLPDGRRQIVTYRIDDPESGFVADVRYEGEAKEYHYEPKPVSYQPKPAYRAVEPVYKPKPVYEPKPVYKPRPTYKPTPAPYKPKPVYTPAPYKPTPAPYKAPEYLPTAAPYKAPQYSTESYVRSPKARQYGTTPAPVYEPVTTTYKPVYNPRPTYKPEPTYVSTTHKPTEPKPYRPTSPKARQNIPSYETSEAPKDTTTTTEAPVYDPSNTQKRRMRYPKKLKVSSDRKLHDSLFYGNVKGRVRAPVRRRVEKSESEN